MDSETLQFSVTNLNQMHVEFVDCFNSLFYDKSPVRLRKCLMAKLEAM